jgi:hypothetical protein
MKKSIAILSLIFLSTVSCSPTTSELSTATAWSLPTVSVSQIKTVLPATQENRDVTAKFYFDAYESGASLLIENDRNFDVENLQVQICISQLAESWQSAVKGISSIVIEPDESALAWQKYNGVEPDAEHAQLQPEYFYDHSCYPATKDKTPNSVKLNFKTVAANNGIYLKIRIVPDTTILRREDAGIVYIKSPTDSVLQNTENMVVGELVGVGAEYIQDLMTKWAVGQLSAQIVCDNCPNSETTTTYSFIQDRGLYACEFLSKNKSFARVSCTLKMSYFVPNGVPTSRQLPEEVYLYGLYDYTYTFSEITGDQFLSDAP